MPPAILDFPLPLRRGPRTLPSPEWESLRHSYEVCYWAARLDEMVSRLPGLRRHRGEARAGRLVRDVLDELRATQGLDASVMARDRLMDAWRGEKPRWRP